ncbi:subtilisin-like serine-protease S [Andrographis paniculata]|uniref:subtilisin-like serine-protease S n=1 Tax=Andrographis paniculata TaxID=175694 RepID=UPI0021E7AAF7|nr:subtilisin-like serine-protease S [Andrographis paniculata]
MFMLLLKSKFSLNPLFTFHCFHFHPFFQWGFQPLRESLLLFPFSLILPLLTFIFSRTNSYLMGSSTNAPKMVILLYLCLLLLAVIRSSVSSKLYVVYMGSRGRDGPDEILRQNHQMLTALHRGSVEQARASHVYSYRHGFRGFAAMLDEDQAAEVAGMPGVVSVFPNTRRKLHTTHSWDFMGLVDDETMEIPGFSTKNQINVVIGFIDTGIWPESPSFSDVGMPPVPEGWKGECQPGEAYNISTCNRKVIGARYYLSGYQAEEAEKIVSYKSARDSVGHGSHTASTAAGRYVDNMNYNGLAAGGARGGAPMARIAVYKTCWSSACYDVDLLAAFDDAIRDRVHIISVSLGGDSPQGDYFSDAISIGSFHAVSRGIVVVASVGNEGTSGSATNLAPWIITVGASSTDRDFTSDIILANRTHISGESLSSSKMNAAARIISASEAYAGYFTPYQSSFCLESSLNSTKAKGKVLVCRHAGSSMESKLAKGAVVKEAGGVGMILIDEADRDVAIPFAIPAAVVGKTVGKKILAYVNSSRNPMSRILSAKTVLGSRAAPRVPSFSSKGPNMLTPEILKPDLIAPGLNILAAWSPATANRNFNVLSGTSMACPHVTGIVALIKSVHPSWSPSAIKSAMMTTASTLDKQRQPITAGPGARKADPFDMGAGFVNPRQVLDPGLVYDATPGDYIAFLCWVGYTDKSLRLITRDNSTCERALSTASGLNYPSITVPNLKESFTVSRTVTNVGRPRSVYRAAVFPPPGVNVRVVPRRLAFVRYGQKMNFTVILEATTAAAALKGEYVFGSLSWRNKQVWVSSPLVVRKTVSRKSGLRRL